MLADDLKRAIANDGRTLYGISRDSRVSLGTLTRFTSGERDMRLETAGKVAEALGLALRPIESPKSPAPPPAPSKSKAKRKKS